VTGPAIYTIRAYGFPGHPFPRFIDGLLLHSARIRAAAMRADDWRLVEIVRWVKGADPEVVETLGN